MDPAAKAARDKITAADGSASYRNEHTIGDIYHRYSFDNRTSCKRYKHSQMADHIDQGP